LKWLPDPVFAIGKRSRISRAPAQSIAVEDVLAKIDEVKKRLNAFVALNCSGAQKAAAEQKAVIAGDAFGLRVLKTHTRIYL
jgi:hypothetical protein